MSGYHARRAPNVSQYLANLNTVPSPHDATAAQQTDISLSDEGLEFLTNAEFFDFDALNVDFNAPAPHEVPEGVGHQYQFPHYPPSMSGSPNSVHSFQTPHYAPQMHSYPPQQTQVGEKRKSAVAALPPTADLEEQSRMAAEEDKRRRNTAASARFRVKKKQREQALEKQSREMAEKVQQLEGKVQQLEMENKWLKGLITDRHDGKTLEEMRKEHEKERSTEDRKDGVGTELEYEEVEEA